MGVKERLIEFISYLGLGKSNFEKTIDKSNGFVDKVTDNIRPASVKAILDVYPMLNKEWLLTGGGSMIIHQFDKDTKFIPKGDSSINKVEDSTYSVPLVPLSALAGKLTGFSLDGVTKQDCEFITSPIKGADFAVPVTGDSMAPEYPSGSRVLVQEINPNSFIEWGKVYVLDTCNGIVIKQLRKSNKDGYVSCFSINDNSIYAPFDISLADIHGIYRVLLCLALK